MMIRILVIYDISDDKARHRISETCLDYGLDRMQFSAFTGTLKPTHVRELAKVLKPFAKHGEVVILPVGAEDWKRRISLQGGA